MYQATTTCSHNICTRALFLSHLEIHRLGILCKSSETPPHFFKSGSFSNSDFEDALIMFFPEGRPHLYPLSSAFPQKLFSIPSAGKFPSSRFHGILQPGTGGTHIPRPPAAQRSPPSRTPAPRPLPGSGEHREPRRDKRGAQPPPRPSSHILFRRRLRARPKPPAPRDAPASIPRPPPLTLRMFS